jgi:polyhydroxyalkanoate synthase
MHSKDFTQSAAHIISYYTFLCALMSSRGRPFFYDYLPSKLQLQIDDFIVKFKAYSDDELIAALKLASKNNIDSVFNGCNNLLDMITNNMNTYSEKSMNYPAIWTSGSSKLLDLGTKYPVASSSNNVIFVPSLLNKPNVFDLEKHKSVAELFAKNSIRSFLFDWGNPTEVEYGYDLHDYSNRLKSAICANKLVGDVTLIGYCMGGLMILDALGSTGHMNHVKKVAFLGTPWDFSCMPRPASFIIEQMDAIIRSANLERALNVIPSYVIQLFFQMLSSYTVLQKLRSFDRSKDGIHTINSFLAIESWLHNGNDLSYKIAKECYKRWYLRNSPFSCKKISRAPIDRTNYKPYKMLIGIADNDEVVPPTSSYHLASNFQNPMFLRAKTGHIGFFGSRKSYSDFWPRLSEWITSE